MDKKIYEILRRSLTNIAQNYIDEYVEQNAEFRAKAGLKAKIIRSTNGKCCKWCDRLAGTYSYPAPREVYQRHDNCDCTVTYVSEKGARRRTYQAAAACGRGEKTGQKRWKRSETLRKT